MTTITAAATYPVSNSFVTTPSYSGSFIPALWAGKLNAKFYTATVFGEIANTNWEGEINKLGDTLIVNNIPDITISAYTVGTNLTYQVPTPSTVQMVVDQGFYFAFQVSDILDLQAKPNLMDTFSNDAAMQMKIRIDSTVLYNTVFNSTYGTFNTSNKGATAGKNSAAYNLGTDTAPVTLTPANILSLVTSLSAVLDEQNVPETDRFLIIDPTTRQVLMNSNLGQAQFMGDSSSILRNGKIGMIDRFTVYVSNNLPRGSAGNAFADALGNLGGGASGGALKRRALLAGHKSGITFAAQMSKMETVRNPNDFGDYIRGLNIFGHRLIKPESLALAVVA